MPARRRLIAAVLLALPACVAPPTPPAPLPLSVDTLDLRATTWFLAQDALRGRGTGDPVTRLAANFIVARCLALGLEPVGGSYLDTVPLMDAGLDSTTTLQVIGPDTNTFRYGADFVVTGGTMRDLDTSHAGRATWLGDPDHLPATLPSLTGAIAVIVGVAEPGQADALAKAGTAGIVGLVGDDATLARFRDAYGDPLRFARPTTSSFFPPIPVVVGGSGVTQALVPVARGQRRRLQLDLVPHPKPVEAMNVGCLLPGSEARTADTAIAFTAHYDHLGVGTPVNGDSIYNGFSDNAAGVAMLLAIARELRQPAMRPRHSVLFLFFTGEERGLLGSDWWVAHPRWPLDRIRAVINLDAGAPPARVWSWRLAGGDSGWLGDLARDVAQEQGWSAVTSAPRANSDYFPFHRMGVPAIFPIPTPAPYEGLSADSSEALRRRWDRYHQPGDEWFPDFPFAGVARYAEYALRIGLAVDGGPNRHRAAPRDGTR